MACCAHAILHPRRILSSATLAASDTYPPPRFTDPDRVKKLESTLPEIDRLFQTYAAREKIPGMIWGVVIDGRLAHLAPVGVRDRGSNANVTPATAFRIASMTKSFTALAILKLRDDGKLSLEDPVSKWIPEFARMELPTRDTPPLTVRQLMSHSAGFPEDNPWGDQQLNATDEALDSWLRAGIPFSTPPGTRYEYSNYAFGLLGRIVAKASGVGYERYMRDEILAPLKMTTRRSLTRLCRRLLNRAVMHSIDGVAVPLIEVCDLIVLKIWPGAPRTSRM